MADVATNWAPRGAWAGIAAAGRFGAGGDGVTITLLDRIGLASVGVVGPGRAALAAEVQALCGLPLAGACEAVFAAGHALVWSGPDQWLLVAQERAGFAGTLSSLSAHAAVADQSQSRAVLRLSGPRVRDVLAKGVMLDLHHSVFPPGRAAATSIAHIGVNLWRREDDAGGAVLEIAVPRSMAGSFWSWLAASAGEFGATVEDAGASI